MASPKRAVLLPFLKKGLVGRCESAGGFLSIQSGGERTCGIEWTGPVCLCGEATSGPARWGSGDAETTVLFSPAEPDLFFRREGARGLFGAQVCEGGLHQFATLDALFRGQAQSLAPFE
jgi:hypothetical protein